MGQLAQRILAEAISTVKPLLAAVFWDETGRSVAAIAPVPAIMKAVDGRLSQSTYTDYNCASSNKVRPRLGATLAQSDRAMETSSQLEHSR